MAAFRTITAVAVHLLFVVAGVVSENFVTVFCNNPGKQLKLVCFRHQILVVTKKRQTEGKKRTVSFPV